MDFFHHWPLPPRRGLSRLFCLSLRFKPLVGSSKGWSHSMFLACRASPTSSSLSRREVPGPDCDPVPPIFQFSPGELTLSRNGGATSGMEGFESRSRREPCLWRRFGWGCPRPAGALCSIKDVESGSLEGRRMRMAGAPGGDDGREVLSNVLERSGSLSENLDWPRGWASIIPLASLRCSASSPRVTEGGRRETPEDGVRSLGEEIEARGPGGKEFLR
jgi:hypothetical protein